MTSSDIKEKLKALKPELEQSFGVKSIGFFGSYARGEESSGSDVDGRVLRQLSPGAPAEVVCGRMRRQRIGGVSGRHSRAAGAGRVYPPADVSLADRHIAEVVFVDMGHVAMLPWLGISVKLASASCRKTTEVCRTITWVNY